MIRRPPTRLELKLEDSQEYEQLKQEREDEKKMSTSSSSKAGPSGAATSDGGDSGAGASGKSRTEIIHDRIGFDPSSRSGNSKN